MVKSAATTDAAIQKIQKGEALSESEEQGLADKLNQPKYFFNEDNLRHAYRNPVGDIIDFVKAALGLAKVKSREEELNENFNAWLVAKNLTPEQSRYLILLKNRGIATGTVRLEDLFAPPLSILNAGKVGVDLFGEQGLKTVIDEMNYSVFTDPQRRAAQG